MMVSLKVNAEKEFKESEKLVNKYVEEKNTKHQERVKKTADLKALRLAKEGKD